jgi:hypothetical protein
MATVTSQLTRITNADGGTWASVGGGPGGGVQSDVFLQGTAAFARRQSNATDHGYQFDNGSGVDLSAAGSHVGMWLWHTHYSVVAALKIRLGTGATSNYAHHHFPMVAYPPTGGWVRVWVDVSRTPEESTGTLNRAAVQFFGVVASLPAVGGTSPNLVQDATDHTTGGLVVTGAGATFSDFVAADEANADNKYGVVTTKDGVIYCLARLTIGQSDASVQFDHDGFALVFADQPMVASSFMGLSVDLQHASTAVSFGNAVVRSAGTTRGDLVVTGSAGSLSADGCAFGSLRTIELSPSCSLTGCLVSTSGQIVANGATVSDCTIVGSTASSALLWDVDANPNGRLDGTAFASGGTGHAIELGAATPSTIGLFGNTFSSYGADGTTNAALYNNSGKHIEVSILGGGGVPTVRNGAGASTTVVTGQRNLSFDVRDQSGAAVTGYEWRLYEAAATPGTIGTVELAGEESATQAGQNYSYTYADDLPVVLQVMHANFIEANVRTTLLDADRSLNVTLQPEENI